MNSDTIYFSGITLAILDAPGRATLLQALREARAAGKTIAFDPNLRPRLWTNDTEMTSTIMEGAAVSDIVLPSFEDEEDHFGDETGVVSVIPVDEVVDTTAAGDSFNAGVFAGLADDYSVADAIALACRLSGLVVQGKGALVPVNPEALLG